MHDACSAHTALLRDLLQFFCASGRVPSRPDQLGSSPAQIGGLVDVVSGFSSVARANAVARSSVLPR